MRPPSPTLFVDLTTHSILASGFLPEPTWIAEAILASSLMYKQIILTEDKRGPPHLALTVNAGGGGGQRQDMIQVNSLDTNE